MAPLPGGRGLDLSRSGESTGRGGGVRVHRKRRTNKKKDVWRSHTVERRSECRERSSMDLKCSEFG